MNDIGFQSILILLGVAVVLIATFRRLHLPQVLAYLCAGIVVGPHGFGWVADAPLWHTLAEFGLVFLLFTIGLEFSLPKLMAMKTVVFGLGGAQVAICAATFALVARAFGVAWDGAVVIGGVLAMSSTAIVTRLLVEQTEQHARHGRYAIGVLLFQDLAVVPFIILIPALASDNANVTALLAGVAVKSALVLGAMIFIGRRLLRPLFHRIAATRLREYFLLTVLLLTLAAAWMTDTAGLSLALGAFLAGMMFAETEYRHQVEADILPFREVLLGLFFVTVGMLLNVEIVLTYWHIVLLAVLGTLLFKLLLIFGLGKLFRFDTGVAFRTGLVLSQTGEFGFALLLLAGNHQVLDDTVAQIVLATVVLSMLLAPVVVWYNGRLARQLVPGYGQAAASDVAAIRAQAPARQGHVILCGYGRSGQNLDWMLEQEGIARFALDLDPVRVREARAAGKPVTYGDATSRDVLDAAGLAKARALVVSFNDTSLAFKVLEVTRTLCPQTPVIVRTMDDTELERLIEAGATEVVPESLEGSLMMGSHVLLLLGVPLPRVDERVRSVRRERYRMLREFFHGEPDEPDEALQPGLHSIELPEGAYAIGKCVRELPLAEVGATVSAVRQGGQQTVPSPETRLAAGDVLVLSGKPEALARGEEILLQGAE
jgi:monovalent cation:H+ antiporter-2, CPA2 family